MKRYIITLATMLITCISTYAMSYEKARQEALYLTDKMAYELNLDNQQYNDAYEINLDYFMSIRSERDLYADYLSHRLTDLRYILHSWQYDLMLRTDYFIRPLIWRAGSWLFPIYSYYSRGHMFFHRPPAVYYHYKGGHGHHHHPHGFYAHRRPQWNGGMRGPEKHHIGRPTHQNGRPMNQSGRPNDGHVQGKGYQFNVPSSNGGQRASSVNTPSRSQTERNNRVTTPSRTNTDRSNRVSVPSRSSNDRSIRVSTPSRNSSRGSSFSQSSTRTTVKSSSIGSSHGRHSAPSRSSGSNSRSSSSNRGGGRGGR